MRKMLNTLHVMTQGSYLHRDGESIAVKLDSELRMRVPALTLEGVVCWGRVSCSPPVLGLCSENGIGVSFLSEQGRFIARLNGPVSGNVLLRRQQYRIADGGDAALGIVRSVITAKIANSRVVLLRAARETADADKQAALREAGKRLSWIGLDASRAASIDEARGHEGVAGQVYFGVFDRMISSTHDAFHFGGRSRRPPLDRVNALLSFVYALLRHDIESALETVGLDPAVGFLHMDRPGRPSLALDLMEELRSVLADRLVLTLVNRRQLAPHDFSEAEGGGITMGEQARKTVIGAWQERKRDEIEHPFLKEKISLGLIPYAQALLLARHVRGGLDAYPAFFWR